MAAPAHIDVHNLNGTFDMNKKLSDNTTAMLKLQGVPWLVQQAANYSAIQVVLKQYNDDEGKVHVDQEQISTGGMRQTEERTLTGEWANREVKFWGKVSGYAKFVKLDDPAITDEYLKEEWEEGSDFILSYVESRTNDDERTGDKIPDAEKDPNIWVAIQVWGFAMISGERKHVRRVVCKKGSQEQRVRLIYDFKPE